MKSLRLVLALGATLPLAACFSFGGKPPEALLTLSPQATVPVGPVQTAGGGRPIGITVPSVPASLAAARVPVQETPVTIAYVKDAAWSEPPARLFARLLSDTLTGRAGRVVIAPSQTNADPGATLGGELRRFGMDAADRTAVVTFDAALMRIGSTTLEKRRFEARVPVTAIDATTVGPALNQAANQVATEVADWVGR